MIWLNVVQVFVRNIVGLDHGSIVAMVVENM